jgi:hypothetical protein
VDTEEGVRAVAVMYLPARSSAAESPENVHVNTEVPVVVEVSAPGGEAVAFPMAEPSKKIRTLQELESKEDALTWSWMLPEIRRSPSRTGSITTTTTAERGVRDVVSSGEAERMRGDAEEKCEATAATTTVFESVWSAVATIVSPRTNSAANDTVGSRWEDVRTLASDSIHLPSLATCVTPRT